MVQCVHKDCDKRALYSFSKQYPLYCGKHKEKGMVNVVLKSQFPQHHYDPRCVCGAKAVFSIPPKEPEYCWEHSTDQMMITQTRHCRKCKTHFPYYGRTMFFRDVFARPSLCQYCAGELNDYDRQFIARGKQQTDNPFQPPSVELTPKTTTMTPAQRFA